MSNAQQSSLVDHPLDQSVQNENDETNLLASRHELVQYMSMSTHACTLALALGMVLPTPGLACITSPDAPLEQ